MLALEIIGKVVLCVFITDFLSGLLHWLEDAYGISFFQRLGMLQSPAQHGNHHRGTKDTYYCVITDYLNPVLEMIRFWPALEWLIYQLFGVRRRPDHSVKVTERGLHGVDVYR